MILVIYLQYIAVYCAPIKKYSLAKSYFTLVTTPMRVRHSSKLPRMLNAQCILHYAFWPVNCQLPTAVSAAKTASTCWAAYNSLSCLVYTWIVKFGDPLTHMAILWRQDQIKFTWNKHLKLQGKWLGLGTISILSDFTSMPKYLSIVCCLYPTEQPSNLILDLYIYIF